MTLWTPDSYGSGSDILIDIDPDLFTGLSDGDPIATGQDASGNGRHMTAAGSSRPTWQTNELNGHAVARFDGTDDVASIADTGLSGQPFVLAAVTRFAAPIAADASLFAGSGWAIAYQFVAPDVGIVLDLGSPLTVASWEGAQPITTPLIVAGGFDGTNTLWRATNEQQCVSAALGTTGYPDAFKVGANAAGTGDFAAMDLARLIVANYTNEGELDRLLGYLAWYYGLESTLPPDSPYLGAAPEVTTNAPSGRAYSVISAGDLAALGTPTDEQIGQAYAVATAAGSSDFVALARENAAGVREWYREGDSLQAGLATTGSFSNLGAGDTGGSSADDKVVDLTEWTEVSFALFVLTAGATGRLKLKYTVGAAAFANLTTNYIDLSLTGVQRTDWEPIPAGARNPLVIRHFGFNGNGTEDPIFTSLVAHFRR